MKRTTKRVLWGIIALLVAVALIFFAFAPNCNILKDVSVFKLIVAIVLIYWFFERIICGRGIADKSYALIPLGIGFLVFEENIGNALDLGTNIVSNWLIIAVTALLVIAMNLIFGSRKPKQNCTANSTTTNEHHSKFAENAIYFDLSKDTVFHASNKLGQLSIFFQNADMCQGDVTLNLDNELGQTNVNVPSVFEVENNMINSLGTVNLEPSGGTKTRKLIINGSNRLGETRIRN